MQRVFEPTRPGLWDDKIRAALLVERQRLVARRAQLRDASQGFDRFTAKTEAAAGVSALRAAFELMILEVDHALERLDSGTYGLCEECSEQISPDQLAIRPQTALCSRCTEQERNKAS